MNFDTEIKLMYCDKYNIIDYSDTCKKQIQNLYFINI